MEAVLKEVMDLFPSSYIHIGGDEVLLPQDDDPKLSREWLPEA